MMKQYLVVYTIDLTTKKKSKKIKKALKIKLMKITFNKSDLYKLTDNQIRAVFCAVI